MGRAGYKGSTGGYMGRTGSGAVALVITGVGGIHSIRLLAFLTSPSTQFRHLPLSSLQPEQVFEQSLHMPLQ
jgi:hypothetical protein